MTWNHIKNNSLAGLVYGKAGAFSWRDNGVDIEVKCYNVLNKRTTLLTISGIFFDGFQKWLKGKHIQDALPNLTPSERELLISGMTDEDFPKE